MLQLSDRGLKVTGYYERDQKVLACCLQEETNPSQGIPSALERRQSAQLKVSHSLIRDLSI